MGPGSSTGSSSTEQFQLKPAFCCCYWSSFALSAKVATTISDPWEHGQLPNVLVQHQSCNFSSNCSLAFCTWNCYSFSYLSNSCKLRPLACKYLHDLKKSVKDDYTPISVEAYTDSVEVQLGPGSQRMSVPWESHISAVSYEFGISMLNFLSIVLATCW